MSVEPPPLAAPGLPSLAAVLAKSGGENFPVAPFFLPARTRRHLMAIYGFARFTDDVGDEGRPDGDGTPTEAATTGTARLALLDALDGEIDRMYDGAPTLPVTRALLPTVRACALPAGPLHRLVAANRCDQVKNRYETYAALRAYCALSADPVGELVLHVFRSATPERIALSDRVCTALQLAEHWQDVGEDYARGRVYLPQEDLRHFRVAESDLAASSASPQVRRLLEFQVERTHELLDLGLPLVRSLHGRPRLAVAAFIGGGRAALHAVAAKDFDVLGGAPRPGRARVAVQAMRALART